jgi:hypothetical protein
MGSWGSFLGDKATGAWTKCWNTFKPMCSHLRVRTRLVLFVMRIMATRYEHTSRQSVSLPSAPAHVDWISHVLLTTKHCKADIHRIMKSYFRILYQLRVIYCMANDMYHRSGTLELFERNWSWLVWRLAILWRGGRNSEMLRPKFELGFSRDQFRSINSKPNLLLLLYKWCMTELLVARFDKSKSELLYKWQFTANQFVLASSPSTEPLRS